MPLNYSKWDQLELSDDSDIEGHPNVDKKSLIRWKQRDIHGKREARNHRINDLEAEIACNVILLERLRTLAPEITTAGAPRFSAEVGRLRTSPSPDAPPTHAAQPIPYDTMILRLLETVATEAKERSSGDQDKLATLLGERLDFHVKKLGNFTQERRKELDELLKEKARHITSDDIHEEWDSKYVPAKPAPEPVIKPKAKAPAKTTEIKVLNAPSASSSASGSKTAAATTEPDDELPEMTPALEEFSRLPLWNFEKSWEFIQNHREVVVPGASDALLVAAFTAQTDGKNKLAKQCVHQSLLLQYGDKLGKDGLRLFFKRMISGGQGAHAVFRKDVEDTYAHIAKRVEATRDEVEDVAGQEQIQLVAENPDTTISFNVPDGPPPENITLEGPGTEDLDIEEVRKALQMRWDLFQTLPEVLQEALKTNELAEVNKVLGAMPVPEAEEAVGKLDMGGILSFAEQGIRDDTGKGRAYDGEEADVGED